MKFMNLRLSGFKSFVDPTELLLAPGLTGIVGPNGCGKSNLLEAMRWVMGESSAKSMRGSGMDDVIFAGAATRPPRNFAEVSLMIDNAERMAPPQFGDAETLEVVRRITRDVGSTYRVNGKETRAPRCSDALCRCGQWCAISGAGTSGADWRVDLGKADRTEAVS